MNDEIFEIAKPVRIEEFYLNDQHDLVPVDEATVIVRKEYDKAGELIIESWATVIKKLKK